MDRRLFIAVTTALAACKPKPTAVATTPSPAITSNLLGGLDPAIASATELAGAMARNALSAQQLTQYYLERIARLNTRGPELRAVLETNPAAVSIAAALDRERAAGKSRGPLHGLPVLIKDNIESSDHMMTTAGSLALEGWYSPSDAPLVANLRRAGAVVLGKTNLSEWANIRSAHSSSGWSARGGQCRNARDLARSPSGSSSGSAAAVAAGLCALAVGSETDGSIVSPSSSNGIVGIKPTLGLVSRSGIIPIAHSQDTAGPMTRSVADAALLLSIMCGPDANDSASRNATGHFDSDYTRYLGSEGLKGARLGVARATFDGNAPLNRVLDAALDTLRMAGATVVDPADIAPNDKLDKAELEVLLYELKSDLNHYMERLPPAFRVRTLADVIRFNSENRTDEMPHFEQELFERAQAKGPLTDAAYLKARAFCSTTARAGIDDVLKRHKLDAIVSLTGGPAWLIDHVNGDAYTGSCSTYPAVAGYPHITVPAGFFRQLPIGLSFIGSAFTEPKLLRLASAYEIARGALEFSRL
jgi:amidase